MTESDASLLEIARIHIARLEKLLSGETPEARREMARLGWMRRVKAKPGIWICCHRCGRPAPSGTLSPGGLCGACVVIRFEEAGREAQTERGVTA